MHRRVPFLALGIIALLAGLLAALMRLGWQVRSIQPDLAAAHGPLMVCGFLGTLISLERAVALGNRWAYLAPLLIGLGAVALIVAMPAAVAPLLIGSGSLVLVVLFGVVIKRQPAVFTFTMALGAVSFLVGNCLWLAGVPIARMFFWWAGFLVLTIVGERLELSRLARPGRYNRESFFAAAGLYVAGLIVASLEPRAGMPLLGAGMIGLAAWMLLFDVARRTISQAGLTYFIALNLLCGYAWLGAAGVMWASTGEALSALGYDALLHSLFLGFVFSMIFAHAPIILPAILGRPLPFRRAFYAHVALLHLSLVLRMAGDLGGGDSIYQWGGMLNVLALLVFLGNTVATIGLGARAAANGAPAGERRPVIGRPQTVACAPRAPQSAGLSPALLDDEA